MLHEELVPGLQVFELRPRELSADGHRGEGHNQAAWHKPPAPLIRESRGQEDHEAKRHRFGQHRSSAQAGVARQDVAVAKPSVDGAHAGDQVLGQKGIAV